MLQFLCLLDFILKWFYEIKRKKSTPEIHKINRHRRFIRLCRTNTQSEGTASRRDDRGTKDDFLAIKII